METKPYCKNFKHEVKGLTILRGGMKAGAGSPSNIRVLSVQGIKASKGQARGKSGLNRKVGNCGATCGPKGNRVLKSLIALVHPRNTHPIIG
jgi:hypothetical protein